MFVSSPLLAILSSSPHLHLLQQFVDDVGRFDVFRFGFEVEDDAVLQNLAGDASDVFNGYADAFIHQGAGFGSQYEVLRGARAGAPVDPFIDETG